MFNLMLLARRLGEQRRRGGEQKETVKTTGWEDGKKVSCSGENNGRINRHQAQESASHQQYIPNGNLPEKIKSGKASRKSIVSSKLYADTDTGQSKTPEIGATRRGRTSKRSSAASTSVLLLEESKELPDEEEEMVLEGGEDVFEAVDEEVAEAETEAQDSPDVSLLMEASSRGRRKRSRALSLLSAPKEGRKLSALPKRSLTSRKQQKQK
ncbi:uncharacterized protein LOC122254506 isoform X2 [Penaeus japonicus]|uniref:uncharacterized protein LOC122254506 isoform X2 n=1 Tax=Penaeus japonicus TaxID=27405 RepID=UPI001C7147DA|nr:uncharacterized protein LOC122254506 isoform X2 [Penaeus japonicus]